MTGLELLKAPEATAGEIADIISAPCPLSAPVIKCKKTPRKKCRFVAERRKKR